MRFPKGVIVDVHREEADVLIEAGKAETVEESAGELDESLKENVSPSSEEEGGTEELKTEQAETEENS